MTGETLFGCTIAGNITIPDEDINQFQPNAGLLGRFCRVLSQQPFKPANLWVSNSGSVLLQQSRVQVDSYSAS